MAQECDDLLRENDSLRREIARQNIVIYSLDKMYGATIGVPQSATYNSKTWRHSFYAGIGQGGTVGFPFTLSPSVLGNYIIYKPGNPGFVINGFFGSPIKDPLHPFISISALIPVFDKPFKRN